MDAPLRILLVGALPDRAWCAPFRALWALQDQGILELSLVPAGRRLPTASLDAHGIICRPSHGGHLVPEFVERPNRPLVVGTLSKGTDHVRLPNDWIRKTIRAVGDANAPAVADLTVTLASEVLRPANEAATEMLHRGWEINIEDIAQQFDGIVWGCLGARAQVKYLLPQLVARRCPEVVIFHPALDAARFGDAISGLTSACFDVSVDGFSAKARRPGAGVTVIRGLAGAERFSEFLAASDVLSLHVPAQSQTESPYGFQTEGIICFNTIEKMKPHIRIVNVARGALVQENDVVKALANNDIGGFAADVIHPLAEREGDPSRSPLWTEFCRLDQSRLPGHVRERRLFLTPHIGGGTREALTSVAADVLPRFLQELGLNPPKELFS